jgi:ATP-dependent DNA helicase RecG
MMFHLMRTNDLYPPLYRELRDQAQEAVQVTFLNEARPPVWEQVSDWIDRNGPIANADLCQIARVDTLKASKMFKRWVEQGVLVADPTRAKRNMVYFKPAEREGAKQGLLFPLPDTAP